MRGFSESVDTGSRVLAFMIAHTSAMSVTRTSCVNKEKRYCKNIESRMRRANPMSRSQAPPIWEAFGGVENPCALLVL